MILIAFHLSARKAAMLTQRFTRHRLPLQA